MATKNHCAITTWFVVITINQPRIYELLSHCHNRIVLYDIIMMCDCEITIVTFARGNTHAGYCKMMLLLFVCLCCFVLF